ncbi:UDP-2,3-diacylglucosamine diphosphatase [Marinobacterium maritimum]|uniref:UDP-2,3-diacylglucosamine hydrolase n=1 Tax=Marinobacterium maritimum TaxID=500162 RepID=A0ABP3TCQ1_9GAMM
MLRYYVADLHLDAKRPDIIRAFEVFLDTKARYANELYLLGDIFEAWIGDDAQPHFLAPIFDRFRSLCTSGIRIWFQHGNRDFLVGSSFAQQTGLKILNEVHYLDTVHGNTLLLHGDQLCTDDVNYQAFRSLVRNPDWQAEFLAKSVSERLDIARQLRDASKKQGAIKAAEITDVTPTAVSQMMTDASAPLMIHGHTHRPCIHQEQSPTGGVRIVLGDWDRHGWYLEQDERGSRLFAFPLPVADTITPELRGQLVVQGQPATPH